LLAVAGPRDVGVDVESGQAGSRFCALARRYFPVAESHLARCTSPDLRPEVCLRLWVRKEACVKAVGARLGQGLGLLVGGAPGRALVGVPR
jgi:4'-phosphopantetheinyl transferase